MLPSFLVIGAAKCGTTNMCSLLGQHPQVFMSEPKEIHFFGRRDPRKTLAWYERFFENASLVKAVGEGSTSYTHPDIMEACAAEIAERIPDCQLIYMVRNPLARLESDWKMRRHEGWAKGVVNEAVELQPTLISHGMYWQNLNVYRRRFTEKQIQVVFLEDFAADPTREMRRCLVHIGADPNVQIQQLDKVRNRSADFRKDGRIARRLRGTPILRFARRHAPRWVVTAAKGILTSREDLTVNWDPSVRRAVLERLRGDSLAFLEYCGKPPDFWSYDP